MASKKEIKRPPAIRQTIAWFEFENCEVCLVILRRGLYREHVGINLPNVIQV